MIQLSGVTKSFGDRVLFDHVTWQIGSRERVGLCGPNGAGKTTLLNMLAGLDEPDTGEIINPAALTVGYLPQDGSPTAAARFSTRPALAFEPLLALKSEMHDIEERLGDRSMPAGGARRPARPLQRAAGSLPDRRRLQHRSEGGDGAARTRLRRRAIRAADRLPLGRVADAAGAGQAAARPARPCCCSTSRPTISTSRRATGSKTTCRRTPTR